jgi:hypothetical protein
MKFLLLIVNSAELLPVRSFGVARLGLTTASRFRLLAKYRSGVRVPTYRNQLRYSPH